jgi:HD-like signal output (HDOD) protein
MTGLASVDFRAVARVVERDPALTAEVMAKVQSAAYSRGEPPRTVEQAVGRLGFTTLRDIATEAAVQMAVPPTAAYGEVFTCLHRHGVATAHLTRVVSDIAEIPTGDAFLAGLFHDVGYMAALMLLGKVYGDASPPIEALWPELDRIHSPVGWRMCAAWELPESVVQVARTHHDMGVDMTAAVVVLADYLATKFGAPLSPFDPGTPEDALVDRAQLMLSLSDAEIHKMTARAPEVLEHIR